MPAPAAAHPLITRNLRVVHFVTGADGDLIAYYRLTLPLVVGHGMARPDETGPPPPAPFTVARRESGLVFWYADIAAIARDPLGLGRLIADGHQLAVGGVAVAGRLLSVAVHPRGHVPPFDSPAQAATATAPAPWPADVTEIDSGYVLVDAAVSYTLPPEHPGHHSRFTLASTLAPGALGEAGTVNLFIDDRGGRAIYYRASGLLEQPLVVAPGLLEGVASFAAGGIGHILTGADHLLFLLCLVLGAPALGALAWRITGFTVGHAITLAAGFFGWVPTPVWFAPAIDAAIAASILLAGCVVLLGRGGPLLLLVTLALGLIHGFGFATSLRMLLAADGPNVIPGLAGFNLGVELGQLAAGITVFAAFRLLRRHPAADRSARLVAVAVAMAVAGIWLAERAPAVWAAARAPY